MPHGMGKKMVKKSAAAAGGKPFAPLGGPKSSSKTKPMAAGAMGAGPKMKKKRPGY